jgi:hypothetical protein
LRAGVSVFAVSRFMGSSIAMIDRHYGHLARDSREHAVSLLDALAIERGVDGAWTSQPDRAKPLCQTDSRPRGGDHGERWTLGGQRDAQPSWRSRRKAVGEQELHEAL